MIHNTFIWRLIWLPAYSTKLLGRFNILLCINIWKISYLVMLIVVWTYLDFPWILIWQINLGLCKCFHVLRRWRWNTTARHPHILLIRCQSRLWFILNAESMLLFLLTLSRYRACHCLISSTRICILLGIILNILLNWRWRLFKLLLRAPHCCRCSRKYVIIL